MLSVTTYWASRQLLKIYFNPIPPDASPDGAIGAFRPRETFLFGFLF